MSMGKLTSFIEIISTEPIKDAEGFVTSGEHVVASVRAYYEQRNSTEKWVNLAQNTSVNALFRMRCIPGLEITTRHIIVCDGKRYNIFSVENVRNRGMYLEILGVCADGSG